MYRNILLAYDGSVSGRKALRTGAELAQLCGAHVHLVAVVVPAAGIVLAEAALPADDLMEREMEDVRRGLAEGAELLAERGLAAQTHLCSGQPAEEIGRVAREVQADLVVVGHREQSALARWWRGSVGQSLLSYAPCSVLVAVLDQADQAEAARMEAGPAA